MYSENHTSTAKDANGIVILALGEGTTNDVVARVAWGSDTHSLKVEVDIEQEGNFVDMGTKAFNTVPYALHAETVSNVTETDPRLPEGAN